MRSWVPWAQVAIHSTERLTLTPLTAADANDLFTIRGDPEVMAFWDWPPDASTAETATIVDSLVAEVQSGAAECWAVRLRDEPALVGLCDLSDIRPAESADAGFMIARRFWGQGFGLEIVNFLLGQAGALGLNIITARIHRENARSRRLLRRAGFCLTEELPGYEIRPGTFRDCERFEARL